MVLIFAGDWGKIWCSMSMQPGTEKRLHSLDILRTLAILLVFMFHFSKANENSFFGYFGELGWMGVDLFFVLSGFLIGNQIFSNLQRTGSVSFKNFYLRRGLRTLPNYLVVLALYLFIPVFRGQLDMPPLWKFLTFTQNFGLRPSAFSHAWSLCIEEQFYFILPIIAVFLFSIKSRRSAWMTVFFLVAGGILLRGWLWNNIVATADPKTNPGMYVMWIYYPTWGRLDGLLFGVGLAAMRNFETDLWKRIAAKGNVSLLLSGLFILVSAFLFIDKSLLSSALGFPLLSLGLALLVLSALSENSWIHRIRIPGAGLMAMLSYAFYLLHKEIIELTKLALNFGAFSDSYWLLAGLSFCMSVVAAAALYLLVERP